MTEFIHALFSYPSALYTGLMGIAVLYWLFVVVGAVDIDLFGSGTEGAMEGASHGAVEGASHGVSEGLADGALDGAGHGLSEGVADGAVEAGGDTALAMLIGSLRLRNAPVTVVYSVFSLAGWAMTMGAEILLHPVVSSLVPGWVFGSASLVLSLPLSLLAASLSIRPLAPLFVHTTHHGHRALIGKSAVVVTGHLDGDFGQIELLETGLDLVLQARSINGQQYAKKTEVLIVDYQAKDDLYIVESMKNLLKN